MVMIRHTFDLRIRYEQFPDTRPAMAYDGDIESDRDRILAWIMEALMGPPLRYGSNRECWRTSHRLSIARAALKSAQIDPTIAASTFGSEQIATWTVQQRGTGASKVRRHHHVIGKRVQVDLPNGTVRLGTVEGVGPRGHKVRLTSGKVVHAAWWRVSRATTYGCELCGEPEHCGEPDCEYVR